MRGATTKEGSPAPSKIVRDMFDRLETDSSGGLPQEASGAGAQTSYEAFKRLDAAWSDMKTRTIHGIPPRTVRTTDCQLPATPGMDVIVAGGTLGIFLAMALQTRGLRTALLERGVCLLRSFERPGLPWQAPTLSVSPSCPDSLIRAVGSLIRQVKWQVGIKIGTFLGKSCSSTWLQGC